MRFAAIIRTLVVVIAFLVTGGLPLFVNAQTSPTVSYSQTNITGLNFQLNDGVSVSATSSIFVLNPNTRLTSVQVSLGVLTFDNTQRVEVYLQCSTNTGGSPSTFAARWVFNDFSNIFPAATYVSVVPTSAENRFGNTNDDPRNTGNAQGFWWTPTVPVNCQFTYFAYDEPVSGGSLTQNITSAGLNNGTLFTNKPYIVLYSGVVTGESLPVFTNQSYFPGLSATTTNSTCNSNFATSSSFLDSVGSSISNGICRVGVFLFFPSPDSLSQFSSLASSSQQKIPFSYAYDVYQQFNALTATTTENVPTYTSDLHNIGIGSTTPIGNILPNMTWLSKETIDRFLPAGIHDALFFLARCGIWFIVIMMFYRRVVPHKAKI